jgi:hypothetical protein
MTIVTRPFVLDFAGAFLDKRPDFPEEVWSERETYHREIFADRWKIVRAVADAFEEMGIYLVDLSASNVAFVE